jgi:hypothetical protein
VLITETSAIGSLTAVFMACPFQLLVDCR